MGAFLFSIFVRFTVRFLAVVELASQKNLKTFFEKLSNENSL